MAAATKTAGISDDDGLLDSFSGVRRGCCFFLPCFSSGCQSFGLWSTDAEEDSENNKDWWDRGLNTFMKIREWSELVAGPKWKTFIRRFNKSCRGGFRQAGGGGKFQYDPSSYALNFDSPGRNGYFVEDDDRCYSDFSSRYASVPATAKGQPESAADGLEVVKL